ncbi:uncharacterized protein LOC117640175 [Thrips palmi]|uniref:Uncharacterized protein LOC117640175 n=1 Tax=Thrips palmi TaxID=161013 RepID=A0A6P8Y8D7_THRPL|nr:uncharacterized protein LOC117640175 [Thrips palmi]
MAQAKTPPKPMRFNEGYAKTLTGQDLMRYKDLLKLCNNVDPCELVWKDCSKTEDFIPDVNLIHIASYLIDRTRVTSMQSMKNYQSTRAYRFLNDGWVQHVRFHKLPNDYVICVARVKHSYSFNDPALRPWALVKLDGEIIAGWCNCEAGCGESCNHLAALLYALEYGAKRKRETTCTSRACSWLPPALKEVPLSAVRNIDLTTPTNKRKRLSGEVDEESLVDDPPAHPPRQALVSPGTLSSFFQKLHVVKPDSAIFRVLPEYCDQYVPEEIVLPVVNIFDRNCCDLSLNELRMECRSDFSKFKVSIEERVRIEKLTRKQYKTSVWRKVKAGRIGASDMHACLQTGVDDPSISLVEKICNPLKEHHPSKWMIRGLDLEGDAKTEYLELMRRSHTNFQLYNTGLYISPEFPFIGASPDGKVHCDCHGYGLVEIKCTKDANPDVNVVPANHYTQMQTQLLCIGPKYTYCDYYVYHPSGSTCKRVNVDSERQDEILVGAENFCRKVILPELKARYFTTLKHLFQQLSLFDPHQSNDQPDQQPRTACYCQQDWDPPMVECVGRNCTFRYFHLRCFGLKRVPKTWLCLECKPSAV